LHGGLRVPPITVPGLPSARLRQTRVVVRDVEPPSLPICVGVDKFVRQVLLRSVLPQLDVGSSDYPRVGGTWLRLDTEELPEKHPMRLDPKEGFVGAEYGPDTNQ
jgi:hypothetical protein